MLPYIVLLMMMMMPFAYSQEMNQNQYQDVTGQTQVLPDANKIQEEKEKEEEDFRQNLLDLEEAQLRETQHQTEIDALKSEGH